MHNHLSRSASATNKDSSNNIIMVPTTYKPQLAVAELAESLLGRPILHSDGVHPSAIAHLENTFGIAMPEALQTFYLSVGNLKTFTHGCFDFLSPTEMIVDNDNLFFLYDSHADSYWGVNLESGRMVSRANDLGSIVRCKQEGIQDLDLFISTIMCKQLLLTNEKQQTLLNRGTQYLAMLEYGEFNNNTKSRRFLAHVNEWWNKVVHNTNVSFFRSQDTLLCNLESPLGDNGQCKILLKTSNKKFIEELVDHYGFWRLIKNVPNLNIL